MSRAHPSRGGWPLALAAVLAGQLLLEFSPATLYAIPRLATPARAAGEVSFPRTSLEIAGIDGRRHSFTVEVATTTAQRSRGLMYRTRLAPEGGMLFLYPSSQIARMWMKDTQVSLDMLFIAGDGQVVQIEEHTEPLSLRTIASRVPVSAVLELRGGRCAELGIGPGALVVHRQFGTEPSLGSRP